MAIELKQQLRLAQQLVITPQLQQAIKLLQLTRLELQQLVRQELTENPILEELEANTPSDEEREAENADKSDGETRDDARDEDRGHEHAVDEVGTKDGDLPEPHNFDWENYIGAYNTPWGTTEPHGPDQGPTYENTLRAAETLQDHLIWQLHLSAFSQDELHIGLELIGNITDAGYLAATVEEIATQMHLTPEAVTATLTKIQLFDPPGVGARNLPECLRLQIALLDDPHKDLLIRIVEEQMPALERHHYSHIAKKLKISVENVRLLAQTIHELEPKPGRPFGQDNPQYISPDVYIYKVAGDYVVVLNDDGMPRLQISRFYRQTMQNQNSSKGEAKEYLQNKLRSAMWLIKSIHQRQQTMYKVTKSIVKFQREFFDQGIEHLRPMILRDVAEDINMHESTVSRVTTNKYVHTPRGIFELKFFFNSGIHKAEGSDMAAEAVKQRIHGLIAKEDPRRPLSDEAIAERLKKDRIMIARRTVAKYRETMAIPPSSQRRRME